MGWVQWHGDRFYPEQFDFTYQGYSTNIPSSYLIHLKLTIYKLNNLHVDLRCSGTLGSLYCYLPTFRNNLSVPSLIEL